METDHGLRAQDAAPIEGAAGRMRKVAAWSAAIGLAAACVVLAGFLLWPRLERIAAARIRDAIEEAFVAPTAVADVVLDPLDLSLHLRLLRVGEPERPLMLVEGAKVSLDPWRSLRAGTIFADVLVRGVELDLRQGEKLLEARKGGGAIGIGIVVAASVTSLKGRLADAGGSRQVEFSRASASFDGRSGDVRLRVDAAKVGFEGRTVQGRAKIAARVERSALRIVNSRISGTGVGARAAGTIELPHGNLSIWLRCRADAERARWLRNVLPNTVGFGAVMVEGTVRGNFGEPRFAGVTLISGISSGGYGIGTLRGSIEGSRKALFLKFPSLQVGAGSAKAAGRLTLGEPHRWQVRAAWQGIAVAADRLTGAGFFVESFGRAKAEGVLGEAQTRASGRTGFRFSRGGKRERIAFRLKAEQREADRWRVAVRSSGEKRGWLRTDLRIGPHEALRGRLTSVISDIAPASRFLGSDWSGDIRLRGSVTGLLDEPRVAGALVGRELRLGRIPLTRVGGGFEVHRDRVKSTGIWGLVGSGRFSVQGEASFESEGQSALVLRIEDLPLGEALSLGGVRGAEEFLGAGLEGEISGRVEAKGKWSAWEVLGEAQIARGKLWGQPVSSLRSSFSGKGDDWEAVVRDMGDGEVGVEASLRVQNGSIEGEMAASGIEIQFVPVVSSFTPSLRGTAAVSGKIGGTTRSPVATLRAEIPKIEVGGEDQGSAEVSFEGSRRGWTVSGRLMGERVKLEARSVEGKVEAQAEIRDVDLASLFSERKGVRVVATGRARVGGSSWRLGDLAGEIALDKVTMARGLEVEIEVSDLDADLRGGQLTLRGAELVSKGGSLGVEGRADLASGALDLRSHGSLDLALLEVLPEVVSSSGQMVIDAVGGRDAAGLWHLQGEVAVSRGALDFGLPVSFSRIEGKATLKDTIVELGGLTARVGGGSLALGGTLNLQGCPRLDWAAKRVAPGFPSWLESRVSGRGKVYCPQEGGDVVVSGEIEVLEALYDRNVELKDLISRPPAETATRELEEKSGVGLDLHVVAEDGVYVDNNVASVELAADLRILGTSERPIVVGKLEAIDGEVYLTSRTLSVSSAVVILNDMEKIDPRLDLFAETEVMSGEEEQHVWVHVSGTAQENSVKFGADDPSLSQNEIVRLLALGDTSSGLGKGNASIPVSQLFALAPVGKGIEKEVVGALPVDRLDVAPTLSAATGRLEPRVTATKSLSADLAAKMSTTLGSERSREFGLEYRLTPDLLLQGSWQSETKTRAGAFGGGLKFRHRFMDFPRLGGNR